MKIPIQNIYYLLGYAWNRLDEAEKLEVDSSNYSNLVNLLARILANGSRHILTKGLDKAYVEKTELYPGIKGRVDFIQSLNANAFRQGRAVCQFDEFSPNVIHNQIIKSCIRRLTRIKEVDKKIKTELWNCFFRFQGVDEIELQTDHFRRVRIHRNNREYGFILNICRLILENTVLNEDDGSYEFIDFTRDEKAMAYLFEDFVRSFYKLEQSDFKVRREDIQWHAESMGGDISLLPKMQTDVTLESKERKVVIETKFYKETLSTNSKVHSNNLYQLFAYIKNLETDSRHRHNNVCEGILLYPTVDKELNEHYKLGDHKLSVRTINLSKPWTQIHNTLLDIISSSLRANESTAI